jgi:hypothetical protein
MHARLIRSTLLFGQKCAGGLGAPINDFSLEPEENVHTSSQRRFNHHLTF